MDKKEIKKLGEEAVEKISGGVESLRKFVKKPGAIFIKKYGGLPIKPPSVKPIKPVKPGEPSKQPEQPTEPLTPANPVQPLEQEKEGNK